MNISTPLNALRDAIAADATWAALTGNAGVILEAPSNGVLTLPFATWSVPGSLSQLDLEGADRLRLDVKFFAKSRAACRTMAAYLREHWTIPSGRAAPITSGDYRIQNIRHIRQHDMPGTVRLDEGGALVYVTVAEWQLSIRKAS